MKKLTVLTIIFSVMLVACNSGTPNNDTIAHQDLNDSAQMITGSNYDSSMGTSNDGLIDSSQRITDPDHIAPTADELNPLNDTSNLIADPNYIAPVD